MPPQIIAGRYRIEREIGRGGMGSVWLCHDEVLGRAVAAKQVGKLPGESTPDMARAMREARSLAALNHRNVVSVYDAIQDGDHIWMVMEYVAGRTLSQIVAEEGPLSPARVARIGAQVADGLVAAHHRGTVHRDVKPGNILVTEDDVAKISDFGIARTSGDDQLTRSDIVVGSPAFFSPELARGEEPSRAADVWALGATLYTAVEGAPPYPEQGNAIALLATIATQRPPQPQRAGVLGDVLARMMDPDPVSRWSMDDAAHALRRVAARHGSGEALPRSGAFLGPTTPASPAEPVAVPVATQTRPAPPPPVAPDPVDDRARRRWPLVAALALLAVLGGVAFLVWGQGDDDQQSADDRTSTTPTREAPASTATEDEPASPEPSASTSEPAPTTTTPAPDDEAGRAAFVESYYGALPGDTAMAWAMLGSDFQAEVGSLDDYEGFWATIDAVSVDDVQPAGEDAVDVSLTYTTDGSSQSEVRRLYLEPTDGGYLIVDDEVTG
ncbi:serine/threonine protein kinase [Nocardioides sp. ChNu-153]|uniref:serine/threonine-protein kinase n=1 Tax=Nocardioides sp. ChNu-153 TaxID=2779364 RepID=UPI002650ECAA|nr:serine/threonine-protein kinase [Nocardioides sp. ChNu-153]MDN7120209.1 serine/threonine protein kinase [Nocardioides sp. ChNu-153]